MRQVVLVCLILFIGLSNIASYAQDVSPEIVSFSTSVTSVDRDALTNRTIRVSINATPPQGRLAPERGFGYHNR
jgi:hypothetical protein